MTEQNWYNLSIIEAIAKTSSSPIGLTNEDAQKRLLQYGPNELKQKKETSVWSLIAEQFKSILIIILLVAVALSVVIGFINYEPGQGLPEEIVDAIVIFAIVLACVVLGFIEEFRSDKAMQALKKMAAPTASVIRDGVELEIPARDLVPGDMVILSTGNRVPADLRLIEAVNLETEEASLTGESTPIEKINEPINGADVAIGDRNNMAYSGTTISYGRGKGIVVATGMQTEFGKIATMLEEVTEEETPLQKNLGKVGKWLGIVSIIIVAIVAILGVFRGYSIMEMFIWGVSLAVAAVPEALPAVVVISLSIGVQKMAKRHALVRRLLAVETLGCTTVICSDKTGTLTQDQMTVRQLFVNQQLIDVSGVGYEPKGEFSSSGNTINLAGYASIPMLMRINVLCNDTHLFLKDGTWGIKGDPTEGALLVVAAKAGIEQEAATKRMPRIDEIPFSSERKKMTTIHDTAEGRFAYSKGAAEIILESCSHIMVDNTEKPLTAIDKRVILDNAHSMASRALRVLGMAYKKIPTNSPAKEEAEKGMVFVGMVGMIDPPREEVKEAIKLCAKAGIKSVMITGDHKITATAIAAELGILKNGVVTTGAELDSLSDTDLGEKVGTIDVYARVSPAHKLRVVDAFSKKGDIVAMTGDGVNDAPALKKADIGIAMGITGTDVTKEAAAMVLTDDNFASIVSAVEEGRGIFNNIKKYLVYLLSANVGEVLIMFFAGIVAMPLPLVAIHLLWVNLTTDGFPALALAVDPKDPDIMEQPPRDPRSGIFTKNVLASIAIIGVVMAVTITPLFIWKLTSTGGSWLDVNNPLIREAQTMVLGTIVLFELFLTFACRSELNSIFRIGFFTNKLLIIANLISISLLFSIMYIPFLQGPFHVVPLGREDWVIMLPLSLTGFISVEIAKLVLRRIRQNTKA